MIRSRLTLLAPCTLKLAQPFNGQQTFHYHATPNQLQKKAKTQLKKNNLLLTLSAMSMGMIEKSQAWSLLIRRINAASMRSTLLMLVNAFILFFVAPFRKRRQMISAIFAQLKSKLEMNRGFSRKIPREGVMLGFPVTEKPLKKMDSAGRDVAARRAIAIQRVTQDVSKGCERGFCLFTTARGDTLFTQSWTPVSIKIKGIVIILHGLNEHSGRYSDFAKVLNASGYKAYGMDWIGHGGSDGLHAYVHSLEHAVTDMKSFLKKVVDENPGLPCFCFGHSTGGTIVLKAVLDSEVEARVAGVVTTSPAIGVQLTHPLIPVLAPILSLLFPRYRITGATGNEEVVVSRDAAALVSKYSDPLVYTGPIWVRTGHEVLRMAKFLQRNVSRMRVPVMLLHGTGDGLTDARATRGFYEEVRSAHKSLKLFDGLLHDLLIEPEGKDIMKVIVEWLDSRLI